ncbi:hypothetical protein D3C80_1933010 [compost metagenome]
MDCAVLFNFHSASTIVSLSKSVDLLNVQLSVVEVLILLSGLTEMTAVGLWLYNFTVKCFSTQFDHKPCES